MQLLVGSSLSSFPAVCYVGNPPLPCGTGLEDRGCVPTVIHQCSQTTAVQPVQVDAVLLQVWEDSRAGGTRGGCHLVIVVLVAGCQKLCRAGAGLFKKKKPFYLLQHMFY